MFFFIFCDVFSWISTNQSPILMKKLTKLSKNTSGKKGWFYSQEMFLFCWLKKIIFRGFLLNCWWWEGCHSKDQDEISWKTTFSSSADDYRPSKFQFNNVQKIVVFPLFFQQFWNQLFCIFINLFDEQIIKIIHFWSNSGVFMKRDTTYIECKL